MATKQSSSADEDESRRMCSPKSKSSLDDGISQLFPLLSSLNVTLVTDNAKRPVRSATAAMQYLAQPAPKTPKKCRWETVCSSKSHASKSRKDQGSFPMECYSKQQQRLAATFSAFQSTNSPKSVQEAPTVPRRADQVFQSSVMTEVRQPYRRESDEGEGMLPERRHAVEDPLCSSMEAKKPRRQLSEDSLDVVVVVVQDQQVRSSLESIKPCRRPTADEMTLLQLSKELFLNLEEYNVTEPGKTLCLSPNTSLDPTQTLSNALQEELADDFS